MFPVSDSPKSRVIPFVNVAIIVACCAVFVYELTLSDLDLTKFFFDYGAVPLRLTNWFESPSGLDEPSTVITSAFIHGGWLHLGGNMLFLWVFGDNIEDALGHVFYVGFYAICAAGAVTLQVAVDTNEAIPMVGASGAIAGVMGAYLVLYPTARVGVLIPWLFFFGAMPIPAFVLIGFWFALQLLSGAASLGADSIEGGVAFFAHIGGFVTGAALVLLARPLIKVRPPQKRRSGNQVY